MAYPTNFPVYLEIVMPIPSGSVSDITLPLSCSVLPTGFRSYIGSGAKEVRFYDDTEQEIAVDRVNIQGSGLSLSGYFNFRYNNRAIDSSSSIRIFAGDDTLSMPEPSSTYGQYNAYDDYYEGYWYRGSGDRTINQRHFSLSGTPDIGLYAGPFDGSESIELDGSTEYGTVSYDVTGTPRTIIAWGRSTSLSVDQGLLSVANSANDTNHSTIEFDGTPANNPVRIYTNSTAGGEQYATITGYFTNTWTQMAGTETTNGASRTVYLNGSYGGIDNDATNPQVNRISIGARGGSSLQRKFSGRISLASVHSTTRAANWIKHLYDAESNQAAFYPPENMSSGTVSPAPLTINGYTADISTDMLMSCFVQDIVKESTKKSNIQHIKDLVQPQTTFTPGTGLGQVDICYYDEGTITGTISYDFNETRSEFLGVQLTSQFDRIKKVVIVNSGPDTMSISTTGNNIFQVILNGPSSPLSIESGSMFACSNIAGWDVSADSFLDLSISVASGDEASFKLLVAGLQEI